MWVHYDFFQGMKFGRTEIGKISNLYYDLVPCSKYINFTIKIPNRDYNRVNRQEFANPFINCIVNCPKHKKPIFETTFCAQVVKNE